MELTQEKLEELIAVTQGDQAMRAPREGKGGNKKTHRETLVIAAECHVMQRVIQAIHDGVQHDQLELKRSEIETVLQRANPGFNDAKSKFSSSIMLRLVESGFLIPQPGSRLYRINDEPVWKMAAEILERGERRFLLDALDALGGGHPLLDLYCKRSKAAKRERL